MNILGISAFYHDSAAALSSTAKSSPRRQEERFTRKKHDPGFPTNAVAYCLEAAGVKPEVRDPESTIEQRHMDLAAPTGKLVSRRTVDDASRE